MRILFALIGLIWVLIRGAFLFLPIVLVYFKIIKFENPYVEIITFIVFAGIAAPLIFWREIVASATSGPSVSIEQLRAFEKDEDEENAKKVERDNFAWITPGTPEYMLHHGTHPSDDIH